MGKLSNNRNGIYEPLKPLVDPPFVNALAGCLLNQTEEARVRTMQGVMLEESDETKEQFYEWLGRLIGRYPDPMD